jgi:hypothetical protein
MLTDAEVEFLARNILIKIVAEINDWNGPPFDDVEETEDGELIPIYGGTSTEGYGSFRCEYMPLAAVKKIVVECERVFDEFTITLTDSLSGKSKVVKISAKYSPESRMDSIRTMAECSAYHVVASFRERLCGLLEEAVEDCEVIAGSLLAAGVGDQIVGVVSGNFTADARNDIEKAAERCADRKRVMLRNTINALPHVIAERGPGAPAKSPEVREREAKIYTAKVEDAYRKLRLETGSVPTKTRVAKELGEGGVNPRTGSDTSLSAFGNKLRRLKVDYDAIAKKVEDELNNNS